VVLSALAAAITDGRDPNRIKHPLEEMLGQSIYQIACGYEDCNDADQLRGDPVFKAALDLLPQADDELASQPTLCRLENNIEAKDLRRMAEVFVDLLICSLPATVAASPSRLSWIPMPPKTPLMATSS